MDVLKGLGEKNTKSDLTNDVQNPLHRRLEEINLKLEVMCLH